MILLDQLNCMTLLAVVCLDWKLQLVEENGRGGLEWAPNCKIQIQITCTSEITGVWAQVWSRCFAYLKACLSFSSSVVDLFRIHLTLKWLGSLLQLSNFRVGIMDQQLLCLELIWIKDVCMYVSVHECTCSSFSPEKSDFMLHGKGVGERYRLGMRGSVYQYAQIYIDKCIRCACQNRVFSLI